MWVFVYGESTHKGRWPLLSRQPVLSASASASVSSCRLGCCPSVQLAASATLAAFSPVSLPAVTSVENQLPTRLGHRLGSGDNVNCPS